MASTAPLVPAALRALQASLKGSREPALRARLIDAIARVRLLYASPAERRKALSEDQGDMRKRRALPGRPESPGAMVRRPPPAEAKAYARQWRDRIAAAERAGRTEE